MRPIFKLVAVGRVFQTLDTHIFNETDTTAKTQFDMRLLEETERVGV